MLLQKLQNIRKKSGNIVGSIIYTHYICDHILIISISQSTHIYIYTLRIEFA